MTQKIYDWNSCVTLYYCRMRMRIVKKEWKSLNEKGSQSDLLDSSKKDDIIHHLYSIGNSVASALYSFTFIYRRKKE